MIEYSKYYNIQSSNSEEFIDNFKHYIVTNNITILNHMPSLINPLKSKIYLWCEKNYGEIFEDWTYRVNDSEITFYFKTKEDAMAFRLRWL